MYRLHDLNQIYSDISVLSVASAWNTGNTNVGNSKSVSPPMSHSPSPVTLGAPSFPASSPTTTSAAAAAAGGISSKTRPLSRLVLGRHTQLPDSHRIRHAFVSRRQVMIQAMTLQLLLWKIANHHNPAAAAAAQSVAQTTTTAAAAAKKNTATKGGKASSSQPAMSLLQEPATYDMAVPSFQYEALMEFAGPGVRVSAVDSLDDCPREVGKHEKEAAASGKVNGKHALCTVGKTVYLRFLKQQLALLTSADQQDEQQNESSPSAKKKGKQQPATTSSSPPTPSSSGKKNNKGAASSQSSSSPSSPSCCTTVNDAREHHASLQGPNHLHEHVVIVLSVLGSNPLYVNGQRVPQGKSILLQLDDVVEFLESGYEKVFCGTEGKKKSGEEEDAKATADAKRGREKEQNDGRRSGKKTQKMKNDCEEEETTDGQNDESFLFPNSCSPRSGRLPGYTPLPVFMLGRRTPSPESTTTGRRSARR